MAETTVLYLILAATGGLIIPSLIFANAFGRITERIDSIKALLEKALQHWQEQRDSLSERIDDHEHRIRALERDGE